MTCEKCQDEQQLSQVLVLGSVTTLLGYAPYYDEVGIYHDHDPNLVRSNYLCSKGHSFDTTKLKPCPNCDYGGGK